MFGTRRQIQLAHWVILFALVLATLAPGISRALAFAKGDASLQGVICSVQPVGQAQGEAPGQAVASHEDCPYCALRADTLAPPPAAQPLLLKAVGAHALPWLFLQAPRLLFAWAPPQARAPPTGA
jgi:Protein of unknown function (DUF2946)